MKKDIDIAKRYILELGKQEELYQPGSFWKNAILDISENFRKNGIASFRKEDTNLNFFVPTYGSPGNGFTLTGIEKLEKTLTSLSSEKQKAQIKYFLDGKLHAMADYRTFISSLRKNRKIDLLQFSESNIGNPIEHFLFDGRFYSRSALNYLLGLSFLRSVDPDFFPKIILEIGGGFGTLGEIVGKTFKYDYKYIDIDLPPLFLIAETYIERAFNSNITCYTRPKFQTENIAITNLPSFTFLPNWQLPKLKGKIDLFVNFISFQEMEPEIVKNYAQLITQLSPEYILLRNLREGKQREKPGALGVKTPILKRDYLNYFEFYQLIETNIIPYGFQTVDGFNSELMLLKRK